MKRKYLQGIITFAKYKKRLGQIVSFQAEKRYINKSTDRVKENVLRKDAVDIPPRIRTFKSFNPNYAIEIEI